MFWSENTIRSLRGLQARDGRVKCLIGWTFRSSIVTIRGMSTDCKIVSEKMLPGGVVCLHDSFNPAGKDWRPLDSCLYFKTCSRKILASA